VPVTGVVDLADLHGAISVAAKELGKKNVLRAQMRAGRRGQIDDPRRFGPQAAQERNSRRIADRVLAVGAVEPHALLRQAVDRRRLDDRMAVAAEVVVEIIGDDEENVGAAWRFGGSGLRQNNQRQQRQRDSHEKNRPARHRLSLRGCEFTITASRV